MKRSYSATARDRLLGSAAGNSPTTPRTAVGTGFPDHASGGFKTGSVAQGPAHPAKETRNLNQIRALQVSLIEKAIFDVAYITIHDNEFPPRASWFLAFVEDLQWLSFIFSQSVFTDLPFWLAVATEPVRALTDYSLFSAANVAVLSLVYVTIALTISVSYFMHAEAKIPMIALRLLRWLITLLLTALSIPCLTILIGGLNCGGRIAAFNVNCATVPHLPLVILNALALLLYLPLLIVGSLVFTETSPTSENPLAKAHGRVDCLAVCLRILLVVLAEFALPSNNSGAWAHIVLVALGLVYQAWKSTTTLPYFEVRMNMLRSGMATAGVTSAIGAIIIKALVGSSNTAKSSQGWWPLLFAAAAVGLVGGAWVTRWTTKRYLSTTIRVWHHICREETAAARDAAAGISADPSSASLAKAHAPGRAGKPGAVVTTLGGLPTQAGATHTQTTPGLPFNGTAPAAGEGVHVSGSASIRGTISRSAIGSGGANQSTAHNPLSGTMQRAKEDTDFVVSNLLRGASNELLSTVHERQPKRRSRVFDSPLYVEVCIRFIRDNPTNKQVALGLQLLERGLVEFPKEPLLLLLASTYLAAFYGDEGLAAADVLMGDLGGTRGGVPLDVKFLAFSRDRALRDRGAHLLDRAAMESLEREVRLHHLRALYTVRDIWELVRITSSLPRVAEAVTRLAEHMAGANVSYAKLIERNPRDKQLLRAYSQYLVFVEADAVRAAQVLEIAEDVEMQESRNHREAFGDHGNTTLERTGGVDSPPPELDDAAFKGKPGIAQTIAEESEGSMVRTAPSIQTKGLVGESGDAVDPRRILWREQRPQDRPHAHSQDSFDSPAKMSPTGGRNRLSGSQTSGTSASRVERHKANMRRVLNERVIRPLRTVRIVLTFGFLFFVATLIGFIVCLQMFNATVDVLQNQFATSRTARRLVSVVLENVRLMVFNNLLGAQADFNTALAALKANIAILSTQLLPVVAQSWNYLKTPPPLFRVYKALLSPTSVDYQALSYNALQISQTVVQAGQTALVYANFGQLTPDIFSNAPELRFLTDNLLVIYDAIRTLPQSGIDTYNQTVSANMNIMLLALAGSLLFLGMTYLFTYRWMLGSYFTGEDQILKMVLEVPKKTASALVLSMEEEIESFKEIIDAENDLLATSEHKVLPSPTDNAGAPVAHRSKKYRMKLTLGFTIVAGLVIAMFAQTILSLNLNQGFTRMLNNDDRRLYVVVMRVFSNEWASLDSTLSSDLCNRVIRGAITDGQYYNNLLVNDIGGLSEQFPSLTVQPRDCINFPSTCVGIVDQPNIGFTTQMASQPLNAEVTRFFDVGTKLANYMADNTTMFAVTPDRYSTYMLLRNMANDIGNRINDLAAAIMNQFIRQINVSSTTTVILFVVTIGVFFWGILTFFVLVVQRLRKDAHAVTTLLYMIPHTSYKDVAGLDAFLDSGGLLLRTTVTDEN